MKLYAGVDWGAFEHAACVVNEKGAVVTQFVVEHTAAGLSELIRQLGKGAKANVAVAVERPSGLLIDSLIGAEHPVVPIHPNVVKASRPRYSAAGGKSDPGDAYILADMLRTDGHRFRELVPASDEVRALRSQVRTRDDLVGSRVRLVNQLTALLESFWPGAVQIFANIESQIGLAFLQAYPTPGAAGYLDEKRLSAFLKKHKYPNKRTPTELLARLRAAPTGIVGAREAEAKGRQVRGLVAILRPLVAEIAELGRSIEEAVAQIPVGRIMMSFPRAGGVNAAQIVSELGEDPNRFATPDQLAAEAGVAPVTRASGKSRGVSSRYACNKPLRKAITGWADNSRRASPWAQEIYERAMARGCAHAHAIRILAKAWCRVLWRCWRDGMPYDESKHGAIARAA